MANSKTIFAEIKKEIDQHFSGRNDDENRCRGRRLPIIEWKKMKGEIKNSIFSCDRQIREAARIRK